MKTSEVQVGERYLTKIGGILRPVTVRVRSTYNGRMRFEVELLAHPSRKLKPRTAAALRPLPTPRMRAATRKPEPPNFERLSEATAWLRAEGFVYVPDADSWMHPDGREATVVGGQEDHFRARMTQSTSTAIRELSMPFAPTEPPPETCDGCGGVAIVCSSSEGEVFCAACRAQVTPALPSFGLLSDGVLDELRRNARERAVRQAAEGEQSRRSMVVATALEHAAVEVDEVLEAIVLRHLGDATPEMRAALEAAYQAGAARALAVTR